MFLFGFGGPGKGDRGEIEDIKQAVAARFRDAKQGGDGETKLSCFRIGMLCDPEVLSFQQKFTPR